MKPRPMIVAGVMSGTSADGINVALVRISDPSQPAPASASGTRNRGSGLHKRSIQLLGHAEYHYPPKVRSAILAAMNAESARVADLARLNFLLGELYADAIVATQRKFRLKPDLIGCHGQTLYHQGQSQAFLGRKLMATWQTGEAAQIAARTGVPVVSDFRPADMAAGGKGAPLVPYLDAMLFSDPKLGRILQNVGGIANLTAIPAGSKASGIFAFDSGPGNMVIDAVTDSLFGQPFDRDGKIAAEGMILEPVLKEVLRGKFFRTKPPKTAGREEFGRGFVHQFLGRCAGFRKADVVATATALTAWSIADAIQRFVVVGSNQRSNQQAKHTFREMILSGGGSRNSTLVALLAKKLSPFGIELRFSDEFGVPSEAKEAVAFAVLAYETWNRKPSNVPSATGAKRPAVLGKISYA